jgi:glucosamine--fructose-6-phosphate aminotransferase (isomerizing)
MPKLMEEICQQPGVLENLFQKYKDGISFKNLHECEVFLIGTGASLSACLQAKYAFLKYLKKNVTVIPAFEAEYYMPAFGKNSMAVIVSQSGESYETRVVCDGLREKKIPFYALSNNPNSYLARNSSGVFPIEAGEELGTATKTQSGSVFLLYLMAAAGCKDALEEISKIPENLQKTIEEAKKYISDFSAFFGDKKAVYITGLDANAPTALQAGLMLKEKVFLHAEGISLAEFRHGPVESIEEGIPVVIVAAGSETIKTALAHADFLSKVCGAKIALVTNSHEHKLGEYMNFPFVWDGEEIFGHICATAPFQILAYHMAAERGYDIDGFKYIGKILSKY